MSQPPIERQVSHRSALAAAFAVLALLGLGACAEMRPLDYTEIHEIPEGPGLLSGDSGAFILYRR